MNRFIYFSFLLIFSVFSNGQVSINTDGSGADSSAILDLKSTSKGFLLPRMTSDERDSISNPVSGLAIFNVETDRINYFAKDNWNEVVVIAAVGTIFNSKTGRTWMDRNLGASRVATSITDNLAFGDLYQWGRMKDGHEKRTSDTTHTNANSPDSNSGNVWDGKFIIEGDDPYDWIIPQDGTLWQSVDSPNNVCPIGFRIPTHDEWLEERNSWSSNDNGPFESIKLTRGGHRLNTDGVIHAEGATGYYWSLSVSDGKSGGIAFNSSSWNTNAQNRAKGQSVRCIKD